MAIADVSGIIPVDECVQALGEVGQSLEDRYKETAMGGLAATATGKAIAEKVLIKDIEILENED
jgi:L-serine dehydratase